MELKDALEIVLTLAEDNAFDAKVNETNAPPALVEAATAQQEALAIVRKHLEVVKLISPRIVTLRA